GAVHLGEPRYHDPWYLLQLLNIIFKITLRKKVLCWGAGIPPWESLWENPDTMIHGIFRNY
ncbi:MAG: hypothetical protein J7L22_07630, partial [Candidatus Marinimicrobia bacterium]|nr:hypothetical protein [Candidatus Neomarinimicrobiota bacterium]